MNSNKIEKENARYHIIEGTLYMGTGALISAQTLMPALIKRLGGSDIIVGAWPVVVYLAFFLPQIFSANYSNQAIYRKPIVIKRGLIQRVHIILIAFAIALLGNIYSTIALLLLFILYISNQITAGLVSPVWIDFFAKTTNPDERGKITGLRTSLGATLGLINGFILVLLFEVFDFPYNYSLAIAVAFLYQMASLVVQKRVVEEKSSVISEPIRLSDLFVHIKNIIESNFVYRKFLFASSLLTISFAAVAFFTVSAFEKFNIPESIVGVFTVLTFLGQIVSGVIIGWIADYKGTKIALIVCAISLTGSIFIAWLAPSVIWFYLVFALLGVNIGTEMMMRYNFAIECAPEGERPMYVGLMNTWLAPFYAFAPVAGWLSERYGYNSIFLISFIFGVVGTILLINIPDKRKLNLENVKY